MSARIIGITGGIGSGKSTVARIIERDWCPVYYTDIRARVIEHTNPKAIAGIKSLFGNGIYLPDGTIDKARIAGIVFSNPSRLKDLNSLIHPLVKEDFLEFAESNSQSEFVAIESAILVSSGFHKLTSFNILVKASAETRIKRVMQRDNATREQVMSRISSQMPDSETARYCKYTIENENIDDLDDQIYDIFWRES